MMYKVQLNLLSPDEKTRDKINLEFVFTQDKNTYGNGYYCGVYMVTKDKKFMWYYLDLRYNTEFNSNKKNEFIINWCFNHWSGENGSYSITSFKLSPIKEK